MSLTRQHQDGQAPLPAGAGSADPAQTEALPAAGGATPMRPDALPASIFRAYDIRGIVGETLTPEIVRWIGRAIGAEARRRGVPALTTGRDGRHSGSALHAALIEGLRDSGRDVLDVGRVPTPLLYFATQHLDTGSGVMVTGSHNPPEYNGLKIMIAGDTLHGEAIRDLRRRVEEDDLDTGPGTGRGGLRCAEVAEAYISRVCEQIPAARGNDARKIVIDCGNGVAGDVAPRLFKTLGHDVVELYCDVDGDFPNHHPDPSVPANLRDLIATVRARSADLGLAFDGDGDRLGVVDGEGTVIWPDRQMMLFADDVLADRPGAEIVFDVKCSSLLPAHVEKLGGRPVMSRTGHSFIKSRLRETGAPLAGEMSGHVFFADRWYGFDDALYTAARLVQILMRNGEPAARVFAQFPVMKSTPELRVAVGEGGQARFVEALLASGRFADAEKTTIDGFRADFPDGWGLIRASNTEPSLVLRFEGTDDAALERIEDKFRQALLSVEPSLELPF